MTATPEHDLMTPAEVAQIFRVDPKTVTQWAKAGKLSSIRTLGGHRRYRTAEVRALLNGEAPGPAYPAPGSAIPGQPGYVVGDCGHRVAASEYRADHIRQLPADVIGRGTHDGDPNPPYDQEDDQ